MADTNALSSTGFDGDLSKTIGSKKMTSFAAVNMSPQDIALTRKKGHAMLLVPELCRDIWADWRKMDLTLKGVINYITFENIFYKYQSRFLKVFDFIKCQDLYDLLDIDGDGFFDEDEQILFLSIMKAKMLKVSKELLVIFEYKLFAAVMDCIKDLEKQINIYQNQMRQRIYGHELDKYHDIGLDRLEDFFENYEKKFMSFNELKNKKHEDFFMSRSLGKDTMHGKLSRVTEGLKFKPRKMLREYQTQERLVALEERVEEAIDFRKELKT